MLSGNQRKYSTFDRELLAAYQAVLRFKSQIEGRNVTLFSDHKPLSLAFNKNHHEIGQTTKTFVDYNGIYYKCSVLYN